MRIRRRSSIPMTLSRRQFLKAAGLGAAACATFPSSLSLGQSQSDIPRRLVLFYTQQGTLRDRWYPTRVGSESDFTLGPLHIDALEKHQSNLLLVGGLAMNSNDIDPISPDNAHYAGTTHAITGVRRQSPTLPSTCSIDQYIAQEINKAVPLTKVPSLELAVRDISFGEWAVSFNQSGAPVPFATDPGVAYDRIFENFVAPDDSAARERAEQDEFVLRWAAGEFDPAASRYSGADREKLESHAAAIRDFQIRQQVRGRACQVPAREGESNFPGDWYDPRSYVDIAEMHMRLASVALACDLTRVVTIALPEIPSDLVGFTAGNHGASDLHDLIHKTAENGELKDNPAAVQPVIDYHQLHSRQFATFLDMLSGFTESDGTSLLDNTLVLWCNQLGSGSHDLTELPWILAGRGQGFVRPGRFVNHERVGNKPVPHNNMFVSLANYMGLPITTFGDPNACTGPLTRLA